MHFYSKFASNFLNLILILNVVKVLTKFNKRKDMLSSHLFTPLIKSMNSEEYYKPIESKEKP